LLKEKLGYDAAFNYKQETDYNAALKKYVCTEMLGASFCCTCKSGLEIAHAVKLRIMCVVAFAFLPC
jgi:NADPH-dependent curcumin reductase CurA